MFAVTAVTGRVGGTVATALLEARQAVRVVVREAGKGEAWAARGCDITVADMDDADRLAAALSGVEGAFILLPPLYDTAPGFPELLPRIAAIRSALAAARPGKVVVLSTIGSDAPRPNLLHGLGLLEHALADLPLPVTVLRAAWFMENAQWDLPAAREAGVIPSYLQPLDRPVPMVSTQDVGRTAAALLQEDWTGHRVVEIEAPRRVTPNEIADAFGRALGRSVRAEIVPRERWETIFREEGMAHPTPRMQMIDGFNEGWIEFRDGGAHARKGRVGIDEAIAALAGTKGDIYCRYEHRLKRTESGWKVARLKMEPVRQTGNERLLAEAAGN